MTSKKPGSVTNTPMPIDVPLGPFGTEPLERRALNEISREVEGEVTGINEWVEAQSGKGKLYWRVTDEPTESAFLLGNLEACPCRHTTRRVRLAVEVLRFCEFSRQQLEMNNGLGAVRAMAQAGSYHGQLMLAIAEGIKKGRNAAKPEKKEVRCDLAIQVAIEFPAKSGDATAVARVIVNWIRNRKDKAQVWNADWGMPPEDNAARETYISTLARALRRAAREGDLTWP